MKMYVKRVSQRNVVWIIINVEANIQKLNTVVIMAVYIWNQDFLAATMKENRNLNVFML